MLGWQICVYRQPDGGRATAGLDSPQAGRLAVWQTRLAGLDSLWALEKAGNAIMLSQNGYPTRFTARAVHLVAPITRVPPDAREVWAAGPNDILMDKWAGRTVVDNDAIAACPPDEWLIIEAWDES